MAFPEDDVALVMVRVDAWVRDELPLEWVGSGRLKRSLLVFQPRDHWLSMAMGLWLFLGVGIGLVGVCLPAALSSMLPIPYL